jgi:soluble lytic murein transglycosylase-like protein
MCNLRIFTLILICLFLISSGENIFAQETSYYFINLTTDWGYGEKENLYNKIIVDSISKHWGRYELPVYPVVIKATIAVESAFRPEALSYAGYAGLMQIGVTEAKKHGLSLKPKDERFIPEKNIMVGLNTLKTKHHVILCPLDMYSQKKWAQNVNNFYLKNNYPSFSQQWTLTLAAYNGGGATVLRAMSYAIKDKKDPRVWDNLYAPENPKKSPLYRAVVDVYGKSYALSKYYQMGEYPVKILNLINSGTHI